MASSKVMSSSTSSDPKEKTVDEVWRSIVAGRRSCKIEQIDGGDEMMTLEDFLVRAGAAVPEPPAAAVKLEPQRMSSGGGSGAFSLALSPFLSGDWSGGERREKRRRAADGDTAAEQRHRRMIKNRESAARSRERKQAYQVELESLAVKLEEENEKLLQEKRGEARSALLENQKRKAWKKRKHVVRVHILAAHTEERLKQLMERVVPVTEKPRPPRILRRIRSMQW